MRAAAAFAWVALIGAAFAGPAEVKAKSKCTKTVKSTTTLTLVGKTVTVTATKNAKSTTTVGAPGFTPVQSSLPGAIYQGSGGSDPVQKRDILDSEGFLYAAEALSPREEQAAKAGSCVTSTSTITALVTAPPTTSTTTKKHYTSTTTLYAACASNNLVDYYNPTQLVFVNGASPTTSQPTGGTFANVTSAYDCCVEALLAGQNGAIWGYSPSNHGCAYVNSTTCSQSTNTFYLITANSEQSEQAVFGNLPCGAFNAVSSSSVPPTSAATAAVQRLRKEDSLLGVA